jgi:hypothetical protein
LRTPFERRQLLVKTPTVREFSKTSGRMVNRAVKDFLRSDRALLFRHEQHYSSSGQVAAPLLERLL